MEQVRPRFRVALLATSVEFGGIEKVLLTLLQHMGEGIELVPVLFTRTDAKERSFFDRLRSLGVPYETLYVNPFESLSLGLIVNFRQALALFRRHRFDLIHSHGYRADVFGLAVSKFYRIPLVSTCHGFVGTDRRLRFYKQLDAVVLRRFNRVIAVSTTMKDDLVAHGIDAERVNVITNAVAGVSGSERQASRAAVRARLRIADSQFVFGYVGRLSEEKGLAHFVEAMTLMASEHAGSRAIVVGDGPRRNELEQVVRERGLADRVDFVGFQSEIAPWYAAMDAFVLPSLTEGTPMALLEAMAHRLPPIASAVGGVPDVLTDGENGLLVNPADVPALVDAMKSLASSPALCARLSEAAACSVARRYDVKTWIQGVRDVYMQTLQEGVAAR